MPVKAVHGTRRACTITLDVNEKVLEGKPLRGGERS